MTIQYLNIVRKYGSKALQLTHSFPESGINILATNPVSLKSKYHLEDMKILAENQEIGNFLYSVMTDSRVVKRKNYRKIVKEMVDNKINNSFITFRAADTVKESVVSKFIPFDGGSTSENT